MDSNQEKAGLAVDMACLLEIVIFEQWIRFYFIHAQEQPSQEDVGCEIFAIPAADLAKIHTFWPGLYPLALALNGKEVSFPVSQSAVCALILDRFGPTGAEGVEQILKSPQFASALECFNAWFAAEAGELDDEAPDFANWLARFRNWQQGQSVA